LAFFLDFFLDFCDLHGHVLHRGYHTILKRAWSPNFKMVWYVFLRPLRPELKVAVVRESHKLFLSLTGEFA
jgi:hypothetical protein